MFSRVMILIGALLVLDEGTLFSANEQKNTAEQEFCRLDKNNDREITFEEFKACEFYKLEHVRRLPFQELKDQAKREKGEMSDDDLKAYLFDKADKNRDRKIDRKEWEEFYNSLIDPSGDIPHGHLDRK
jgi:hypothetical protein